jgi:hypothetical protein
VFRAFGRGRDRSPPDSAGNASFRVLDDTASGKRDLLEFRPYAEALAFLIDQKDTNTPLIAAISAPWGAGKTTLAQLVKEQLQETLGEWDEHHIVCEFNAWRHDDAPNLGAAFAAEAARGVDRYRHWWLRFFRPLPSSMLTPEQRWRRKIWVVLACLAATVALVLGPNTHDLIAAAAQPTGQHWINAEHAAHGFALSLLVILASLAFIYPKIFSGTRAIARYINDPQSEAVRGSTDLARAQLGRLIASATRGERRFVVFVDDLERCRPPRAVEVCEVAAQLLDHPDVVTVLVADMETVARSAAIKYMSFEHPNPGEVNRAAYEQYGRSYLEKIVQLQLDLPSSTPEQLKRMLQEDQQRPRGKKLSLIARLKQRLSGLGSPAYISILSTTSAVIALFYVLLHSSAGTNSSAGNHDIVLLTYTAAATALVGGALTVVPLIWDARRRRRARETRSGIDGRIRDLQAEGKTIEETARQISGEDSAVSAATVRRRYFAVVLADQDKSPVKGRVDLLINDFLPERPRAAKRLYNQARLMLPIAVARKLLELQGDSSQLICADRFGKWLVLRERWPEIARIGQNDPSAIADIEKAAPAKVDGQTADGRDDTKADEISLLLEKLQKMYGLSRIDDISDLSRLLTRNPLFGNTNDLTSVSVAPPQFIGHRPAEGLGPPK